MFLRCVSYMYVGAKKMCIVHFVPCNCTVALYGSVVDL